MSPANLFWHLANLLATPLGVALILVLLAKGLVWRRALQSVGWRLLWGESALAGAIGLLIGLAWLGVEGKLSGYTLMLVLMVLPLGWRLSRLP